MKQPKVKQSMFNVLLFVGAFIVSIGFYFWMGEQPKGTTFHAMHEGGPLVSLLITFLIAIVGFFIERVIAIKKAGGKGSIPEFVRTIKDDIEANKIEDAINKCNDHQSSIAAVIRAGLEKNIQLDKRKDVTSDKRKTELQKAFEDATSLEMPTLEKNLVAISTLASISTMVGLLGTTFGMIKAFAALATGGAPDAVQLSLGISEALFNTAGGILAGILAIVEYNYFPSKIDAFSYVIDETTYYIVETLSNVDK